MSEGSAGDPALCVGCVERGAPRIMVLRHRGHFNCHTGRAVQGQSKLSKHGIDLVVRNAAPPSEANRSGDVRQGHRATPERTSATIEESTTVGDIL